jgi:hypothetical protein
MIKPASVKAPVRATNIGKMPRSPCNGASSAGAAAPFAGAVEAIGAGGSAEAALTVAGREAADRLAANGSGHRAATAVGAPFELGALERGAFQGAINDDKSEFGASPRSVWAGNSARASASDRCAGKSGCGAVIFAGGKMF